MPFVPISENAGFGPSPRPWQEMQWRSKTGWTLFVKLNGPVYPTSSSGYGVCGTRFDGLAAYVAAPLLNLFSWQPVQPCTSPFWA